jgi:hypothetical protein
VGEKISREIQRNSSDATKSKSGKKSNGVVRVRRDEDGNKVEIYAGLMTHMREVHDYWSHIQQSLSDVFSITEQNRMNIIEFLRHQRIWEKRARQRLEHMKSKNGKR